MDVVVAELEGRGHVDVIDPLEEGGQSTLQVTKELLAPLNGDE